MQTQLSLAIDDVKESIEKSKLWIYLGWSDIQSRYKGSVLGPFWITLSMSIFIVTFGFVYGRLLHQELHNYIPFLTCGVLIWTFISTILTESCDVFYNAKSFICQIRLPYLVHIHRIIWRNIIIFLHNSAVYIFVACYFHVMPNLNTLLFIPAFILIAITMTLLAILVGIIATRYRDIPPVISSILQIVFFVTPITWLPSLFGDKSILIKWNPVYYYIDIVREPLLGELPALQAWICCVIFSLAIFILVTPFFILYRRKIPYWL